MFGRYIRRWDKKWKKVIKADIEMTENSDK